MTCLDCKAVVEDFSSDCKAAITRGDLVALKCLLADGDVTLHSQDGSGQNLLDLTLHALKMSWLTNELTPISQVSVASIINTGLWFQSRGLTVSPKSLTERLPGWFEFANTRDLEACSEELTNNMGLFLKEASKNEQATLRAARLIGFILWNPDQTVLSPALVTEIIQEESLRGKSLTTLNKMEKEYWKDPDVLSPGIEGIILRPMIALKRNPLPKASSEMRHSLRGVRWLLLALLRLGVTEPLSKTVEFIANYLKLCQELPILADGFRDTVTVFADRNGILNVWAGVLEQVENSEEPLPKVCDLLDPYLDQFHLQGDKNSISIL